MNDYLSWLGLETGHNLLETGHNMLEASRNALETGHSMRFGVASIRWGLTLLHFLWQGAIIGLLALVAARLLRNHSAAVRYWLHATALLACPICVAWTFATVEVPETWQASSDQHNQESRNAIAFPMETSNIDSLVDVPYPTLEPPQEVPSTDAAPIPMDATAETPATAPVAIEIKTSTASEWMPVVARWVAILYAVGVICFLVRLAIALWGGHRLRAISKPVSDSALLELIRTQAHRIGLKLVPVVAYCERVAVPTVIGVLRPIILLPATLTTGLTTEELSAILSHELAHIRRYDLWMNLLQRIIESLLFFHPVVWFLSHRLSAEREICCDDLVIRSGHQPMNYAGALLRMAELCAGSSPQNSLALAATSRGESLLEHRVLRLIHETPSTRLHLSRSGLIAVTGLILLALALLLQISRRLLNSGQSAGTIASIASIRMGNEEPPDRRLETPVDESLEKAAAKKPNASTETLPEKTGTPNAPAPEAKASADQKPLASEKAANRYRILSADGEPVSNAVVRLIYQKEDFRELIAHSVKHQTTTDADGYFQYPKEFKVPFQVANEQDSGGHSATWITVPANEKEPEQTWLLGSSAGVRFPYFEAIAAMMRDPKKASSFSETSAGDNTKSSSELPNEFRLPKFETTIRVVNADGSPAAGVQVTPSQIAWARVEGGSKNIFVPDIIRDSLSQTTDADGRVTFTTIDRMEFAEIEFRSEQHGLQRTFTNMNTIGPELEHDVVLFPAGKVTGTIRASTADQKEFLRTNKLLLQTQVINLGLPAPKGFRIAMEGIAEVTPDEQGRFEIPAMLAGQMFQLDRLPDTSLHRITFKPRQITKSSESSLIEGQVISAVKIQGIARKRDSKEGVAGIPISIRHGGRQAGLSRELTVYARTDANGRFEAHVFPGRAGYSSLTTPEGYVQAWNWDLDYDAKQEWLYGQRIMVPGDTSNFELPPLEFIRAKEIRGKLVDTDGNPVAKTGVYARARANQNGNDFATTDQNGEFVLKSFADGYFPEAVQVGEQFKLRPARLISRDPLILQDSEPAAK